MKTIVKIAGALALFGCIALAGCPGDGGSSGNDSVTITFDSIYGGAIDPITVKKGAAAGSQWPADPSAPLGFSFGGWFADAAEYTADTAIKNNVTVSARWNATVSALEDQPEQAALAALFDTSGGFPTDLTNSWKVFGHHNALFTQGFGADPTALVYNDRLYIFASNDSLMYDTNGNFIEMTYGAGIQGVRLVSSADLVNWTDHGVLNIAGPASTNPLIPPSAPIISPGTYASASWAPTATWKMIDGNPQFFLYYGNSGNGVGVISADSPTGPWTSPLDKLLIDRQTPNCATVNALFDPGVMVDDDGSGYLFFGGGEGAGNARRVKLGDNMISLDGDPEEWEVPYLFEDNEIVKIFGKYYYSYVTNSQATAGLRGAQIAYMMSDDPLGSYPGDYSSPKGIMLSPRTQLSTTDENNHHCLFTFKNKTYIVYHAQTVKQAVGYVTGKGCRSTHIDAVEVDYDGAILPITMTRTGVAQVGKFNPYLINEAETIGVMGGIYTRADENASGGMVVTSIDTGDWLALYGVDFGSAGATKFTARVRTPDTPADYSGAIELRLDPAADGITADNVMLTTANTTRIKGGEVIGRVLIKAKDGASGSYTTVTVDLDKTVTGVHDLAFIFSSSLGPGPAKVIDNHHKNGFEFDQWQFLP